MNPQRAARWVTLASIFISASLAAAKIDIGLMANSTSVVSDGFESAGDVLASGLVLVALFVAAKPPDAEHPYGHGRFETLTGLLVGVLLIATGVLIGFQSIEHLAGPRRAPATYAVWPLVASITLKSFLWGYKRYYGRKIRSEALTADAWNDAVDTLSGITALVAVLLAVEAPVRFTQADHWGGFAVGLIVIFLGLRVVRDTSLQLMDTMPAPPLLRQIREVALGVPGALGVEKCFARKTGLKYHVDLHLEVDPAMTVLSSHEIATEVRGRIREKLDWVADVMVHVEPYVGRPSAMRR